MSGRTTSIPGAARIAKLESRIDTIDDLELHYWLGGDAGGPPVVLWHGFLGTAYTWAHVAPRLVEAGCRVLVPDMPGYGDSGIPDGDDAYDARALARRFRSLARAAGMTSAPVLLVAHDMGAPPAILWASDHPGEIAGVVYVEAPVLLGSVLREIIAYTPEAMARGSMWWWILPLAPGVVERLVVGNERAFLTWFYEGATADGRAIAPAAVDEYLRTFHGARGVLATMGVYRTAFTSIAQTEPLARDKVERPVLAIGGERGLGASVGRNVRLIAKHVEAHTLAACGHFVPEERPDELVDLVLRFAERIATDD